MTFNNLVLFYLFLRENVLFLLFSVHKGFPGFGFGDGGFHMSFGIGAFPFGFITSSFQMGDRAPAG